MAYGKRRKIKVVSLLQVRVHLLTQEFHSLSIQHLLSISISCKCGDRKPFPSNNVFYSKCSFFFVSISSSYN